MKRKLLFLTIGTVIVICLVAALLLLIPEQEELPEELTLSNYPELFEKEVVIVIGENATQIGYESILRKLWNADVIIPSYANALRTSSSNSNIANFLWCLGKYSGTFGLFGLALSILSVVGGILSRKRKKILLICGILLFIGITFLILSILFYQPGPI